VEGGGRRVEGQEYRLKTTLSQKTVASDEAMSVAKVAKTMGRSHLPRRYNGVVRRGGRGGMVSRW
jgi:hypothetical protein